MTEESGKERVTDETKVLAPLMFVFFNEKDVDLLQAEANTFFCFSLLIAEFRDLYIRNMDTHQTGEFPRQRSKPSH